MTRAIGIGLVLLLAATGGAAHQDPPVVVLDVAVSTSVGVPARGLTTNDFEIESESRLQRISFVSSDPQPVNVVFLMDLSVSARRAWKTSVPKIAATLAGALRPGDGAMFGGIAGTVTLGPWMTAPGVTVSAEIARPREDLYGPSPIWDATWMALDALSAEPGRRAIVLLSDGKASGNLHGLDEVRTRAAALGITVNVVGGWPEGLVGLNNAVVMLKSLASTTGGLSLVFSETAMRGALPLSTVAMGVMNDLRGSYRVGFVPDVADGGPHALRVRIKVPGFTVRAREQYMAGKN